VAYVFERQGKDGKTRFTAMYKAENGKYRSAGTYDDEARAQQVADTSERHAHLQLAETSPAEKATITIEEFMPKFLREHGIEPNSKQRYSEVLQSHAIPYIGHRRVAEISRETFHRLLAVVLKDEGVGQPTILYVRTALSAMMQMAWDHGYRGDNPLRGIRLKGVPNKPIVVATSGQFTRVYDALPHEPARLLARLGVASGARLCELISFVPEDFDFDTHMLSVNKSTVEVTAEFHPEGYRFLTRSYTKNGDHRRFKIDGSVSGMVLKHIEEHGIKKGDLIFPVRLFAKREASGRPRMSQDEVNALGFTEPLPNGRRYKHGTMGAYATAKCRCSGCKQWSADYARDRKRERTGRSERVWSPSWRRDPTEYLGTDMWRRIWNKAVQDAKLPFAYTPYQVRHTHASWLIDKGVDLERVRYRLGHGDLATTTRYVKVLDEEDSAAADVIASILGEGA
jgi:integrase